MSAELFRQLRRAEVQLEREFQGSPAELADREPVHLADALAVEIDEEQAAGDDYFSLMRQNLAKLRAALGCR